jgi:hypothetical protein
MFSESNIIKILYYSIDNIFVWLSCFPWAPTVLLFSLTRSFIILLTTYLYGGHVSHGFLLCSSSRRLAPLFVCETNLMQYFFMKNEKKLSWSYNLTFRYINDVISLNLPSLVTLLIAYIPLNLT